MLSDNDRGYCEITIQLDISYVFSIHKKVCIRGSIDQVLPVKKRHITTRVNFPLIYQPNHKHAKTNAGNSKS